LTLYMARLRIGLINSTIGQYGCEEPESSSTGDQFEEEFP